MKCFKASLQSLIGPPFLAKKGHILVNFWGTMFVSFLRAQNGKPFLPIKFLMLRYVIKNMFIVRFKYNSSYLTMLLLLPKVEDYK
jgi:hypothetical protein